MELIKPHHKPSQRVKRSNLKHAKAEADAMVDFLDNGNAAGFKGNWEKAVGISHCQVSEEPLAMFVIASELVGKPEKMTRQQNKKNWWFPSRMIFNAEIIWAPEQVERLVPKREIIREKGSKEYSVKLTGEKKMVSNLIEAPDACMSYPNRTKKNTKRYHTIKVRYQVLKSFLGFMWLSTITEEVTSLKAHIFQHEIDHAHGIDMYFGDGEDRAPEKPYKNAGIVVPEKGL